MSKPRYNFPLGSVPIVADGIHTLFTYCHTPDAPFMSCLIQWGRDIKGYSTKIELPDRGSAVANFRECPTEEQLDRLAQIAIDGSSMIFEEVTDTFGDELVD